MVLINNLTIDEINAALLHLQRARTEVVGGTKGSTVQNITISNKGGGSTVDYAPTITALSNRIDKNTDDIESVEDEIDKIQETLEQLSDNGISSMTFDPVTRQLQINTQDGEVYSCDITSENITLNFDATTNKLTLEMGEQYQEVTLPYINANEKGAANGVATLDSSGRVPYSQLPESAMEFLGNWNASTNTPHLQDGTGTNGDFYVCNVGGTVTFGTGNTQTFVPNDRVIYNGTTSQWIKLPAGQVSSVNGMSGDVTLTATNIEYSTGVSIKAKIDANAVQADWNVTDTTSLAYIKNKPTIPASPVQSDWNVTDTTSLAYIKNKPSVAVLGNTAGCALGTASAGSCTTAARSDHVHPIPSYLMKSHGNVPYCAYMACGNTLNITPANGNSWINYTGGSACTTIGNGAGGCGTLIANGFCGKVSRTSGFSWIAARDNVVAQQQKQTRDCGTSYNPVIGVKTWNGHWSLGTVGAESLMFTYDTDANYNANINDHSQINLPTAGASGTLALLKYDDSGYWGMTDADGGDSCFIRTTAYGLIPKVGGVYNNGHGYLGTSSWYFGEGYISTIHANTIYACCFCGLATSAPYLSPYIGNGSDNITALKSIFDSTPKSVGVAAKLQHGTHSMAFGWFLSGYACADAYGGWFVSDYNIPKFVGINNGDWKECTIITSDTIGSQHVACADCATCATCISGELYCSWDWTGACARIYRLVSGVMLFQIYGNTCQANIFEAFCRIVCSRNLLTTSDCYHSLNAMGTATTLSTRRYSIASVEWYENGGDMCQWHFHGPGAYVSFCKNSCCMTTLCYMSFLVGL